MKPFLVPANLAQGISAFFTGKEAGADTNMIARLFHLDTRDIYLPVQKHTDKIHIVRNSREPKIADAVMTTEKGLLIGVQVADCVPVLVYDPHRQVVAAVHAGWRGTAQEIVKKTLRVFIDEFRCTPNNIHLAIGPAIRKCCYEVDGEVFRAVQRATGSGDYHLRRGDKFRIDLSSANRAQAMTMDVPQDNIWVSDDCTFCSPEKFYSYRFAKGPTGRQGGFIGIF